MANVINDTELLNHWQGHRALTQKLIELIPEKELFAFSIGGMRSFSEMAKELLAISNQGMIELVSGKSVKLDEQTDDLSTKAAILDKWNQTTELINQQWKQLSSDRFHEQHNLFGEYEFPVYQNILYFIDNEIHHRGQGYVYLRALGITPPFFWERGGWDMV